MSDRSRLYLIFFNRFFFFLSFPLSFFFFFCSANISVWSEILLFVSVHWRNHQHQPHMLLQTPSHSADHYCYSFLCRIKKKKRRKVVDDERRKTTDNDLSLFRLSSIAGWHETNTARHNCSPMTVNVRYRPIDQWLGELSNGGYRLRWLRLYSPGHDMERERKRACVGNEAKDLSGWSRHSVCRKSSWSLSHAMHMKTHFMIIISLD